MSPHGKQSRIYGQGDSELKKRSGKKDRDIRSESRWEKEYIEPFNGMLKDEFMDERKGF